jgi:PAS domain S-box-containing protein
MKKSHRQICGLVCWTLALVFFSVGLVQANRKTIAEQAKAAAEREQAARDLAAATSKEQAVNALIDSAVYGMAIVDQSGRIVSWNLAMARLSGWPTEEAIGKNLAGLIPEEMRQRHSDAFRRAMADPKAHQQTQVVECAIQPRDLKKKPVPVRVTVRVVNAAKGPYAIATIDRQRSVVELDETGTP